MSQTDILIEKTTFRLFVTREAGQFRAFWFCPFNHCFGAFRSDRLSASKEEALRYATEAAHRHHSEMHESAPEWCSAALRSEEVGRVRIHG